MRTQPSSLGEGKSQTHKHTTNSNICQADEGQMRKQQSTLGTQREETEREHKEKELPGPSLLLFKPMMEHLLIRPRIKLLLRAGHANKQGIVSALRDFKTRTQMTRK